MKRLTLKKRIIIIDLLLVAFSILVPLIVFGAFDFWLASTKTSILYWIAFAVFPLMHLAWLFASFLRKENEVSITYVELILSGLLILFPYINMVFALIRVESSILFIIPLLIDIVGVISYVAVILLLNFVSTKASVNLNTHKSIKIERQEVEDYEDQNGAFKGAQKGE